MFVNSCLLQYLLCVQHVDWWKWWILVWFSACRFPQWQLKKCSLQITRLWSKMKCLPTGWVSFLSRLTLGCLNICQVWLIFCLYDKFFHTKEGKNYLQPLHCLRNLMGFLLFSFSSYLKQMIRQTKKTPLFSNSMLVAIQASLVVQVTGTFRLQVKTLVFFYYFIINWLIISCLLFLIVGSLTLIMITTIIMQYILKNWSGYRMGVSLPGNLKNPIPNQAPILHLVAAKSPYQNLQAIQFPL